MKDNGGKVRHSKISIALAGTFMLALAPIVPALAGVDERPAFDVAVVKINKSGTGVDRIRNVNGTFLMENVSLKRYIAMAWSIPESQEYLIAGPEWIGSENYDIRANYSSTASQKDSLLMLQRLLEERFHMRLHREPREFSAYSLTVAKGGAKLKASSDKPDPSCGGPRGGFRVQQGHALGCGISMERFADRLSRPPFGLERPVVDMTGLPGLYDITLDFADGSATDDARPAPMTAVREQLGLKVESRKIQLDVLVVDHADKVPAEN
jgi:uncharacterized protein (TIGR03435 family)